MLKGDGVEGSDALAEARLAMSLNIQTVRCAALFASTVQRSERPSPELVRDAIIQTVRRLGARGCAAAVAQEFGDHPETALSRMRWAREQVALLVAGSTRPGPRPVPPARLRPAA
jgi:hypothetical protein